MENKTNEELAIEQFLAKDERASFACACMGPALLEEMGSIHGLRHSVWEYDPNDYEPECRCRMYFIELVNDTYYKIEQSKTDKSIEFKASLIGPRGGPYLTNTQDPEVAKKKTAADRIKELKGEIPVQEIKFLPLHKRAILADVLASNPKNVNWISRSHYMDVGDKQVEVKTEIIDGKFVTSIDGKIIA